MRPEASNGLCSQPPRDGPVVERLGAATARPGVILDPRQLPHAWMFVAVLTLLGGCLPFDDAFARCVREGRCVDDAGVRDGGSPDGSTDGSPDAGSDGGNDAGRPDGGCVPKPVETSCAGEWCEVYATGGSQPLSAVHGFSPTDVWVAGAYGFIAHWDGCDWTPYSLPDEAHIDDIYGVAPSQVWFVGSKSIDMRPRVAIRRFEPGGVFSQHEPSLPGRVAAASGVAADDIWFVGESEALGRKTPLALHWNGTRIVELGTTELPSMAVQIDDVETTANGDVWIALRDARVSRRRAGLWETFTPPAPVTAFHAPADDIIWAVGGGGSVYKLDARTQGATFVETVPETFEHLFAIHGSSPTNMWIVGAGGVVLDYDGFSWSATYVPPDSDVFQDVWVGSPSEVWIVTHRGKVLHNRR